MLQVEDDTSFDAVLDQVHKRAREPAVIRQPSGALARNFANDAELGEGGGVVCESIDEFEQDGRRRVQEGVQQRLLLVLLRRVGVG